MPDNLHIFTDSNGVAGNTLYCKIPIATGTGVCIEHTFELRMEFTTDNNGDSTVGILYDTNDIRVAKWRMSDAVKLWHTKILCTVATCTYDYSAILLNAAQDKLYTGFSIVDNAETFCLFNTYLYADGNVDGSRYRLSVDCTKIYSIVEQNGNIYYNIKGSSEYLAVYYPSNSSFGTIYTISNYNRMTSYSSDSR